MGLFDVFKKKKEIDPLHDLTLPKLKVGYVVDYDLKSWQVTGYYVYDYGDGYIVKEWELKSGDDLFYLCMEEDDEIEWSISRKIPLGMIEEDVKKSIVETEDPPKKITVDGKTYYLDESDAGSMRKDGTGEPAEFIEWTFIDEKDEHFITIEQWGEEEFEAVAGQYVEEYQFTNILPGTKPVE